MNRSQRLAHLEALLENIELQIAQAELDARLQLGDWKRLDCAWLGRARERLSALCSYVTTLRQGASPTDAPARVEA